MSDMMTGGQVFLIDTGMVFGGRSALVIEPNGVAKGVVQN